MKILSVDDNAENLYLIEAVARARGCEVVSARNGLEALEALETQTVDLIISDVLMPEMDGFQLCHEVKNRERTAHIPFIFYTATYTARQDERLGLALGASRFVIKPADPDQFFSIVEEVIREQADKSSTGPGVELKDTAEYLQAYNARLFRKLDRKIGQLETARRDLQRMLEERDREVLQRKRAEEEKARMEAQLLQSQKLESVGRLAGGVAHDFNNLLTVINGYSDLILQQLADGDPLRASVQEIYQAGSRAAGLTRQLLAFSRRQKIAPALLNLTLVVSGIRNMIERLVGDNIEVETRLAAALQPVLADEGQIHQVLLNLVVNARDAMPDGGRLTIETTAAELDRDAIAEWGGSTPGPYVLLTVCDTGTGMTPETLEHIFEPFFTTKEEGKGTGLGLAMVYGIVRQSGGWIRTSSQPGCGATFRICLPASRATADAAEPAPPHASAKGTETVLVAEDHESVRALIVGILRGHGYQALPATSCEEAVSIAGHYEGPIHLLVSDIQMPRISGPELAGRILALRPRIRVLFVSGCVEAPPAGAAQDGPGVDYVIKPFTPTDLATKVRNLLDAEETPAGSAV